MSVIRRAILTNWIIDALKQTTDLVVGDAEAPRAGGWDNDPGAADSTFTPYLVVTPMASQRSDGSFADSSYDWRLPYTIASAGVTRYQTEDHADWARAVASGLLKQSVDMGDGGIWKIIKVGQDSIGAVSYNNAIDPNTYIQTDVVTFWMSKGI